MAEVAVLQAVFADDAMECRFAAEVEEEANLEIRGSTLCPFPKPLPFRSLADRRPIPYIW